MLADAAVAFAGAALSLGTHLYVTSSGYLVLMAVACTATGVVMLAALIPLRRDDVRGGLLFLAFANWSIALLASTFTVFTWPLMVLAALLPAVLAPTLVAPHEIRLFVAPSIVVAFAVSMLGLLQDVSGISERAPATLKNAVLIGIVPIMGLLIALIGVQHRLRMQSALDDAVAARDQLAAQAIELRRSRSRLVAAGDLERRRIERDLHDGAQQRLTALRLQLRDAAATIHVDPSTAPQLFDGLLAELRVAQTELRTLAQGLFPPVLAEHGLTEALRSAADHAALPVTEDLADVGRFDAQNEAAVYFCCLEALHNAAEHAGAERIWLRIARLDDTVHFEVADDGDGFDPRSVSGGSGLANMRDRIGAAGGTLDVVTEPGFGCRIVGSVPVVPPA